jgi:hypothetical protein
MIGLAGNVDRSRQVVYRADIFCRSNLLVVASVCQGLLRQLFFCMNAAKKVLEGEIEENVFGPRLKNIYLPFFTMRTTTLSI